MRATGAEKQSRGVVEREAAGAATGAVGGALLGMAGGPAGAIVGAVLGAASAAAAEVAMERSATRANARDAELDAEIGVTDGDLGAPILKHPPARVGAYSTGASGAASPSHPVAEGPMQTPDDEE